MRGLSLLLLLLALPARADDTDELMDWARSVDTRHGEGRRASRPGDYVTNFGTILDRSCIGRLQPRAREEALETFESDIGAVLQQVRECHQDFPWLGGLLGDAVSILRRSVVTCASAEGAGTTTAAAAVSYPIHTLSTPDSHGSTPGQPARTERLYYLTLITRSMAEYAVVRPAAQRAEFYFHETLHYTGANNRSDHDTVEVLLYDPARACALDAFDDRVIFLVALCGFPGHGSLEQIGDRIRRCGLERGCMRSLTDVVPHAGSALIDPHMYGAPFAAGDARFLCRRVQESTAAAARETAAMIEASQRAGRVADALSAASRRRLLTDGPAPAPRYLAALTAEERARIAADPRWPGLPKLCVERPDGTIAIGDQPRACPLSDALDGDRAASELIAFNNEEVELARESRSRANWLGSFFKLRRTLADLDRVEAEIRELYARHCPAAPEPGRFVPSLCAEGAAMLGEASGSVRRAATPPREAP